MVRSTSYISESSQGFHIRVTISGGKFARQSEKLAAKIADFHSRLRALDRDWPYITYSNSGVRVCASCGGVELNGPALVTPSDVKRLGKQLGLRVSIDRWSPISKCMKTSSSGGRAAVEYISGLPSEHSISVKATVASRQIVCHRAKQAGAKGEWVKEA